MLNAAERSQLETLFYSGRFAELENRARLMLEQYPGSGFIWNVLGMALQMQRKDGVAALQRATELFPDDADMHCKLGNALSDQGQLNEAEASYRRSLEIKPDYAEVHNNLGLTLKELRRLDEAEASYRRALEIKPDYAEAHSNLGLTLKELWRLDEAEASHRKALEIQPDFAEAYSNLGNTLKELGRLDEAEACYRHALQINPDFAEAYSNLGNALKELSRLGEAEASYRRALEIKPDFADAYSNLAGALKEQGKLNDALAYYQEHERLKPGNSVIQHHIASLTGLNTESAPTQYVEKLFDGYAYKFDTHLQQVLKYEIPEKLVALIRQDATLHDKKWNVLDLGCGTGLCGSAIAPFASQLVGVDLSSRMLEKAYARNLYKRLEHLDLVTMMRGEKPLSYDVIIATDVFIYVGKLDETIGEIKRLLCPGGIVAFSIETLEAFSDKEAGQSVQHEYQLEKTGRYSHFPAYITRLASANNLQVQRMETTHIRMENGKPINGHLVILKN